MFFRCIMLFYFRKGKNATQTRRKICAAYGEDAVSERMCQKWFAKFCSGEMGIEDAPRSGRLVTTDVDQITTLTLRSHPGRNDPSTRLSQSITS